MTTGVVVLACAVALAVVVGVWRAASDGRFRGSRDASASRAPDSSPASDLVAELGATLGEQATLLQFSSAFCAPCRVTRRVLTEVAEQVPGVVHVEVDAEEHLDATRRLHILRTPTTIVLDARGAEVTRAAGAPTRAQVVAAIGQAVGDEGPG